MALALSPDLRWLAVGGDGHLRVYSVDSGEQQFERLGHKTEDLVFTRDSDRLLAPSGGDLLCIHTGRWTIVATFKDNIRTIHAIAYCAATESVFTSDVSRDVRHYRAAAAPRIDAVR
jgi:hypothetical protein